MLEIFWFLAFFYLSLQRMQLYKDMNTKNIIIAIDNGHGSNTPGKCSPDKKLLEYKWAREIAKMLQEKLISLGFKSELITPEEQDISLKERVSRANTLYKESNKNMILISIHVNAAKSGEEWQNANGWMVFVSNNASKKSKLLAQCLYKQAELKDLKGNRWIPEEKYWQQSLAICRDTNCPAVLTENLFMDNKEDVAFLLSKEGKEAIVDLHIKGILDYVNRL